MRTLKVISALLSYPTPDLQAAADEMRSVIAGENVIPGGARERLYALISDLEGRDIYDAQERYILLFDRMRSLSLHLFEHVHGESRDRGQAMVDLIQVYEKGGYSPTAAELPDYLPLFLEYASTRPAREALELIGQPGHVLAALQERLEKRSSPYAAAFAALVAMAGARLDPKVLDALRAEPDFEPDDLEALDAAWEEEEVIFGPGAAADDCGRDALQARLRAARRPAPDMPPPVETGPKTIITTPLTRPNAAGQA
jgi:nitrate reductase delta subunit